MKNRIFALFALHGEIEDSQIVIERLKQDSFFRGTNIWILIFAIFIASLGLNINSTAVIIGAMLISPLMGPIMGIGLGIGINDLHLTKEALKHFTFAVIVSLATSFIYFSITPLNDAYSELLSRTTPTIYDVLIAFFGGLAGILANNSSKKGNVIPGVAIATALMPPLCTAGYGLATFQFSFFAGAIYLFTINTVFIALATLITVKFLKYPIKHLKDPLSDKRSLRAIWIIIVVTTIPSIYFGYEMIQQNRFLRNSKIFIESHSSFEGSYLLNKDIDPSKRHITLIYGGKDISEEQINDFKSQLNIFGLNNTTLTVKQGISFLSGNKDNERISQLTELIGQKNDILKKQSSILDSLNSLKEESSQILNELKIQYPQILFISIKPLINSEKGIKEDYVFVKTNKLFSHSEVNQLEAWLRIRLKCPSLLVKQIL
jgi:uncharacterized hydrophobic protein (TIGR00271 family)